MRSSRHTRPQPAYVFKQYQIGIVKLQQIHLRVSQDKYDLIQQNMKQSGYVNMSAYLRKMAINGLIVKLDMPAMKEILRLLRYNGNNFDVKTTYVSCVVNFMRIYKEMAK